MVVPTFLQVALGGAIGASLRFGVGLLALRLFGAGFPVGTLLVNTAGSLIIGIMAGMLLLRGPGPLLEWSPLLMTGILGGFTTFSTFSLDTLTLIQRDQVGSALVYVLLSVGVSLMAVFLGWSLAKGFLT